jgi:hypothetical protein
MGATAGLDAVTLRKTSASIRNRNLVIQAYLISNSGRDYPAQILVIAAMKINERYLSFSSYCSLDSSKKINYIVCMFREIVICKCPLSAVISNSGSMEWLFLEIVASDEHFKIQRGFRYFICNLILDLESFATTNSHCVEKLMLLHLHKHSSQSQTHETYF